MESKEFQLIPNEIIEAWISGEFYCGDVPSVSYEYLGVSLALRGWYTYEAKLSGQTILKGVAKIDFKDGTLFIGGMRIYSIKPGEGTLFWFSEFSHFLNENEIIWVYKIFHYDDGRRCYEHYLDEPSIKVAQRCFNQPQFGLGKDEWNHLLDRIRLNFYDDLKEVEADCERKKRQADRGLLHFFVKEKRAQYSQIYSQSHTGALIGGEACYTRICKL
jgi:hypothetical protein